MKSASLLHFFLAAVLCYSQFVATTHGVSHLQPSHPGSLVNFIYGESPVTFSAAVSAHHSNHQHSTNHTHGTSTGGNDDSAELDCAIYHAVLSLHGALESLQQNHVRLNRHVLNTRFSQVVNINQRDTNQPIRGPPTHS